MRKLHRAIALFGCFAGTVIAADTEGHVSPLPEYPLAPLVERFRSQASENTNFEPTGLSRESYLEVIQKQVHALMRTQKEDGSLWDRFPAPALKAKGVGHVYYAPPNYAYAVSVLVASGYEKDPKVLESGIAAMDYSVRRLKAGNPRHPDYPDGHTNFYSTPTLQALKQFNGIVPDEKWKEWEQTLSSLKPAKTYSGYGKVHNNWQLVYLGGEYLRAREGWAPLEHADILLEGYRKHITPEGLFVERGAPFAYDGFGRYFLHVILNAGYDGTQQGFYSEALRRGAWTSLFYISPHGEMPLGFRSAQHIWNEAQLCAIFESAAREHAAKGDHLAAAAFKRGAHLALQSIINWTRADGSGYIVKNRYPTNRRYGYEGYSTHVNYNCNALAMLAAAWEWAESDIQEGPAPTDIGGYVFELPDFHKIIACAGGNYLQYNTTGDHRYNGTGLTRVHLAGTNPLLSTSEPPKGTYAIGPQWVDSDGRVWSLAELSGYHPELTVLEGDGSEVAFRVLYDFNRARDFNGVPDMSTIHTHKLPEDLTDPEGSVTIETYRINEDGVHVTTRLGGESSELSLSYPVLIFDGANTHSIEIDEIEDIVLFSDGEDKVIVSFHGSAELGIELLPEELKSRNGKMQILQISSSKNSLAFTIESKNQ